MERKNRRGIIEQYRITPGVKVDYIGEKIDKKKYSVAGIITDDTKNRQYVVNKILENMFNGITEEEAVEIMMQDEIVEQFRYLEKNGCNIKECFRNWAKGYKNRKDKEKEKLG